VTRNEVQVNEELPDLPWPATRLTQADGYSVRPQAAAFGQAAYLVWQDNRSGKGEVYFTKDRFRLYLPVVMKGGIAPKLISPYLL
jgi:hypothetical protein